MLMRANNFCKLLMLALFLVFTSCENEEVAEVEVESFSALSDTISVEEAQAELEQLLYDVYGNGSNKSVSAGKRIAGSFTVRKFGGGLKSTGCEVPVAHIFNFENHNGFAIMSGSRSMPSLFALADTGELVESASVDNPGFAEFLQRMEDDCDNQKTWGPDERKEYGEWKTKVYKEGGYCKVKWGQRSPYNNFCPEQNGQRTATGCVATAVAQLMSIYKYPTSRNGYSYSWSGMTASKKASGCSLKSQEQIARLMAELGSGENLSMEYGVSASGAKSGNIVRTLANFGYSNSGSLKGYNTDEVVSELKDGYSVLVVGYSAKKEKKVLGVRVKTTYSGGHCWLCHGLLERRREVKTYDSNNVLIDTMTEIMWYPLCNWGWDGVYDGYFLSGAFDAKNGKEFPGDLKGQRLESDADEYNFQYSIKSIIGIRK